MYLHFFVGEGMVVNDVKGKLAELKCACYNVVV